MVVDVTLELTSSAYWYLLYITTLLSGSYVQNGSGLSGSRLACVVPQTASIGICGFVENITKTLTIKTYTGTIVPNPQSIRVPHITKSVGVSVQNILFFDVFR